MAARTAVWWGVIATSHFTACFTNINDIYGGGGRLLGGSYLLLLYVGMLYGKYSDIALEYFKKNEMLSSTIGMAFVIAVVVIWRGMCRYNLFLDKQCIFGDGFNPPGITFMLYALCIFNAGLIFGETIGLKIKQGNPFNIAVLVMQWIGKRTLYIFLYHLFMIECFAKYFLFSSNRWALRVEYMVTMILGSCLLGEILKKIRKVARLSYGLE